MTSIISAVPACPQAPQAPQAPEVPQALLAVEGAGLTVPVVGGGVVEYANLDYAASAPCLSDVAEHVARVLPYSASVHRGAGFASQVCTSLYEGARRDVARFVGARDGDLVVFTRNTTDAVNLLARALPATAGGVVLVDLEHHANLLPWRGGGRRGTGDVRCVATQPTLEATLDALAAELRAAPVALLAVTGASNVTGETPPLARLARMAHDAGARFFVDAAQLAPHRPVDMAALGIDYLAFSGHKLYAPFGAGVLVGPADWLDSAAPYLAGGGAVREVSTTGVDWATGPARHEAGTPNLAGATAIAAACRVLTALPPGAWERHETVLRDRLLRGLGALDDVVIHRIWPDGGEPVGVVTFSLRRHDPALVSAFLSAEHGIGVRAGRFCAHPLLARLGAPGGALRASVGVGTTVAHIDRLLDALATYLRVGPGWGYAHRDGQWQPTPDDRRPPAWVEQYA
ncbi:aminotransferase class V-fold PLP-dependent enzyme, partial [Frankia canadensis]|uniref:aminotransferase class V-fold PLP-dependent enzyme n=1 Tax=Frankia canadensis TaxID=1836972 RepID=UPI000C7B05BA